jgi:hypothetical protein
MSSAGPHRSRIASSRKSSPCEENCAGKQGCPGTLIPRPPGQAASTQARHPAPQAKQQAMPWGSGDAVGDFNWAGAAHEGRGWRQAGTAPCEPDRPFRPCSLSSRLRTQRSGTPRPRGMPVNIFLAQPPPPPAGGKEGLLGMPCLISEHTPPPGESVHLWHLHGCPPGQTGILHFPGPPPMGVEGEATGPAPPWGQCGLHSLAHTSFSTRAGLSLPTGSG